MLRSEARRAAAVGLSVGSTPLKTWPMGSCALESGGAVRAIPVRKMKDWHKPTPSTRTEVMP